MAGPMFERDRDTRPAVRKARTRPSDPVDATLINLNLMLVRYEGGIDYQAYTPLGILYLASSLERLGYNVEFVDYQMFTHADLFNARMFAEAVGECAPVVGISCMSNLVPFAILVAQEVRRLNPKVRVVLGGVGPAPVASEIVQEFPFIDCVVQGEGELPLADFMRGDLPRVPPQRSVQDLDELPLPAYHLLDPKLYDAAPSVITSRGCPYKCTFCTEPGNFGGVRFRDVDRVLEEIRLVHERTGRTLFLFQDDILPLKPSRFRRLLAGFRELPFEIQWKCFSRVDLMNDALMEEMVSSGCVQVRYGIESGSDRTLTRIKKGFDIDSAYEVVERSAQIFPSVHVSFIWGYPFEEIEDFRATLHQRQRFEDAGATVLLFELAPLPGSPLYHQHRSDLVFDPGHYSSFIITGHETIAGIQYEHGSRFKSLHDMIRAYPGIFSGFYRYSNSRHIEQLKTSLERQFIDTRRTAPRNAHDL